MKGNKKKQLYWHGTIVERNNRKASDSVGTKMGCTQIYLKIMSEKNAISRLRRRKNISVARHPTSLLLQVKLKKFLFHFPYELLKF